MFRLAIPDNDIHFFRDQGGRKRCPVCGQLTAKRAEDLSTISIHSQPRADITTSVDGVCVVLPAAKTKLEQLFGPQLRFQALQGGLHALMPTLTVSFDAKARGTRFVKQCSACGEYESIVGATPVLLVDRASLPNDHIARTDIEFGSNDEKSPVFILGDDAAAALSALHLTGCTLVHA
jgi:hypothetical protein